MCFFRGDFGCVILGGTLGVLFKGGLWVCYFRGGAFIWMCNTWLRPTCRVPKDTYYTSRPTHTPTRSQENIYFVTLLGPCYRGHIATTNKALPHAAME